MGCDIHSYAEIRADDGIWEKVGKRFTDTCYDGTPLDDGETDEPFFHRDYGMFRFLANVRNYSHIPPIAPPRGLPADVSTGVQLTHAEQDDTLGVHSASYLGLEELLAFDYDTPVEDRRVVRQAPSGVWGGGATAEPGGGDQTTYREFLGSLYFERLGQLAAVAADCEVDAADVRIVFWFDN